MTSVNLGDECWGEPKSKDVKKGTSVAAKSPFKITQVGIASVLEVNLDSGKMIRAESNALITTVPAKVTITFTGGFLQSASRALAGESFFLQEMTANEDGVLLELAPKAFHGLAEILVGEEEEGGQGYYVRKDGFFASEPTIQCSGTIGGVKEYMAQSLVLLHVTGTGYFIAEAFGGVKKLRVPKGQTAIVDNSHLVAWPVNARYDIRQAGNSFLDSIASGEWAVLKFKGPCDIYVSYAREETVEDRVKHQKQRQQQPQSNELGGFLGGFLNGNVGRGLVPRLNIVEEFTVLALKCFLTVIIVFGVLFVVLPRLFV